MSLCTVPSLDILQERIFIYLDIRDILNLIDTNQHLADIATAYLTTMKTLDFSKRWHEAITERHFNILHENCTNIVELNFNDCFWLTGPHLKPLVQNNMDHLVKINLRFCRRLNLVDIVLLTQGMSLEEFTVQGLRTWTEDDLEDFEEILNQNTRDYWDQIIDLLIVM